MIHSEKTVLEILPDLLREALETGDHKQISALISNHHPEDIADSILTLGNQEILDLLTVLDKKSASEIVSKMDSDHRAEILEKMDENHLIDIVEEMATDDATDLIAELDDEMAAELLAMADRESLKHITTLLKYPEDTAGGIMDSEILYMEQSMSCEATIRSIRENTDYFKDIHYVYVTDSHQKLLGFVTLPALITATPSESLRNIMNPHVIAVDVMIDQAKIADIMKKYDLITLPVVDAEEHLVGLITIDDIIDVIEEENEEDMLKMAAITPRDGNERSNLMLALYRMPWLLSCFMGSVMSGLIIHFFTPTLTHLIVLTSFIPAVMGMGGNSGIQTSTVTIRNLVTSNSARDTFGMLILREIQVASLIGLFCGGLATLIAYIFYDMGYLGLIVGISMFFSIFLAACMGIMLPFLFDKTSIDPAVASGPVITTLNDSMALIIYLGLSTLFIYYFSGG